MYCINKVMDKNKTLSFYDNFKNKNLGKSFLYYWVTSGVIMSLLLIILEFTSYNPNFVEIYAFFSGSFFIFNFFQFYIVNNENKNAMAPFLIQTIIGGSIWVLYGFIMYFLYIKNFSIHKNTIITLFFIIIISLTQCILVLKYDFYKKIGLYN